MWNGVIECSETFMQFLKVENAELKAESRVIPNF